MKILYLQNCWSHGLIILKTKEIYFHYHKNCQKRKESIFGTRQMRRQNSIKTVLFADFKSDEFPKGGNISGEAFKPRGNHLLSLTDRITFT